IVAEVAAALLLWLLLWLPGAQRRANTGAETFYFLLAAPALRSFQKGVAVKAEGAFGHPGDAG
ncbi:hypothetical protein, partial [Pseudomonas sp. dw_358]|uniref:hypothetical protein n=1 Tax=Pseudomonas sp. dw_358 TaxID=2720083 RepID=UPI001BD3BF55